MDQVGFVHKIGGEDIPVDERFFLGGINTMRGFENREIGPREPALEYYTDDDGNYVLNDDGSYATRESTTEYDYIGGVKEAFCNLELIFRC